MPRQTGVDPMVVLSPDELLTTTRAVRRRLDLRRPVERRVIEECIAIASQAPNAGNGLRVHFVVVTDEGKRKSLAQIYRKCSERYFASPPKPAAQGSGDSPWEVATRRRFQSELHLYGHLHEVPVHVIPCVSGRADGSGIPAQAARWGTVYPAAWSFMLAGRARGLGMTFTTIHLNMEAEAAKVLGIPFDKVMQAGLLPVAYTKGSRFKPGLRAPTSETAHWDKW